MHARDALGLAAGLMSALALSLSGCGTEPAPPGEPVEATPPAAEAPPQSSPPPQAAAPGAAPLFVVGQQLPEGFPSDLPVPADASYAGSFANQDLAARWTSAADATQLAEQLRALYEADDWTLETVHENGPESLVLASRGTRRVIVAVSPEPAGGSRVDVFVHDVPDLPTP